VQGRVGLDDDVLVRGLLQFVDQHGFASLQSFGDFGMHTQRKIRRFVIGGGDGHLARFGLNFVAERRDGFDHAGAGAIRARLAEHALQGLLGALAGDADEAEFVEGQRLGRSFVLFQRLLQRDQDFFRGCGRSSMSMKVDHDDAAKVAQANPAGRFPSPLRGWS